MRDDLELQRDRETAMFGAGVLGCALLVLVGLIASGLGVLYLVVYVIRLAWGAA